MRKEEPDLPGPGKPVARLIAIMARLRGESGCPWDRNQDLNSLLETMEGEYRELVQAVKSGDRGGIREELGDLFYNIVFMARVAEEQGWFTFKDMAREIGDKLIRRHPYVFELPRQLTLEEATRVWKEIKAREKAGDA